MAGGAALNHLLKGGRRSSDFDLFHDTTEALRMTFAADQKLLIDNGFGVEIQRDAPSFVEAGVYRKNDRVIVQWARDSAFRFFPLIEDPLLGLTMHPFDLATNKILAMAGRLEPRDWIDVIECHRKIQPLGYLAWAASGKDPGVNPDMLLSDAGRLHYSQLEIDGLDFNTGAPSVAELSREWKDALMMAREIIAALPDEHLGECLLRRDGCLYTGPAEQLQKDLDKEVLVFHRGTIGGAWPQIVR